MRNSVFAGGCAALATLMVALVSAAPQSEQLKAVGRSDTRARASAGTTTAGAAGAAEVNAVVGKYCITCHNQRLKTSGLTLDTEGPDFSGGPDLVPYQDLIEFVDDNHRKLSSQLRGPDGKWNTFIHFFTWGVQWKPAPGSCIPSPHRWRLLPSLPR